MLIETGLQSLLKLSISLFSYSSKSIFSMAGSSSYGRGEARITSRLIEAETQKFENEAAMFKLKNQYIESRGKR